MVITKQLEKEAIEFMTRYWDTYFEGNIETWATFLTDDYKNIGGTEEEIWNSKQEILDYTNAIIDQMIGTAELRNKKSEVFSLDPYILVHEFADIYIKINEDWSFYGKFRLSSMLKQGEQGFQVVHQHGSYPDSKTEQGEAFAFDKISTENRELKDAVKRRTIELEHKTRELEVEAALEKVRSRSLAMHKSNELNDVVSVLFEKLKELHIPFTAVGIAISIEGSKDLNAFVCGENEAGLVITNYRLPYFDNRICHDFKKVLENQSEYFVGHYSKEEKDAFYTYILERTPEFSQLPESVKRIIFDSKSYRVSMIAVNKATFNINDFEGKVLADRDVNVIQRFAHVFDQCYTRFLDLQKAEAQAREAQIEAAVEKVRAQSMAMYATSDLYKVNEEILKQLYKLNVNSLTGVSIYLVDEQGMVKVWDLSSPGNISNPSSYSIKYDSKKFPVLGGWVELWKTTEQDYFVLDFPKESLLLAVEEFKEVHPEMAVLVKQAIDSGRLKHQWAAAGRLSDGLLAIDLLVQPTDDIESIVTKMAGAFNLAYQRFQDLQKAEAQAREAQIEVALERVRSRTMAMQRSDELGAVASVLFEEMNRMVTNLWTCGFVLCEKDRTEDEWWLSMDTGFTRGFFLPNVGDIAHATLYEGWLKHEPFRAVQLEGELLQAHYDWLMKIEVARKIFEEMDAAGLERPTWQKLHAAYFSKGYLVLITREPCGEEEIFKRFAQVFDLTYTRFLDLKNAEAQAELVRQNWLQIKEEKLKAEAALRELKATQTQLIQAEKMASLGELTAGIAHEIQNPLNFVNNFSEVSSELVDEMKEELEKGDLEEARAIASDIKQNLEKIGHHGKRADAIVKGMLQHSRSSAGEKELTDINKLADEFLRLAYHGVRAKQKDFNVTLKTDYDPSIGSINIVSQDIGRVILNLINNAFYAAHEKKKQIGDGYEPEVTISTRRAEASDSEPIGQSQDWIILSVGDNGNGIPQKIMEKIFQPFFTTKPTGEGTGLGLSLCYDIIKSNGGDIKVDTIEGKGAKFIISLPQI